MESITKQQLVLIYILVVLVFVFATGYATAVIDEANFNKQRGIISSQQI